ncbi:hypothetical protein BDV95DRAFT_663286 [Massariosphaeria phaeospora]|uniref:Uncharacterized protein n=1 Tax=Massariosphaeria phaeospora TaxID=100035 RepID=A0A7C8MGN6_9PLEO|nr:hypothetical protein BDV95DRAFT_663286 [Massariosphaeria phaeospora]
MPSIRAAILLLLLLVSFASAAGCFGSGQAAVVAEQTEMVYSEVTGPMCTSLVGWYESLEERFNSVSFPSGKYDFKVTNWPNRKSYLKYEDCMRWNRDRVAECLRGSKYTYGDFEITADFNRGKCVGDL